MLTTASMLHRSRTNPLETKPYLHPSPTFAPGLAYLSISVSASKRASKSGEFPRTTTDVHPEGFYALFADGSVRFLKGTITPEVLDALLTRNGGEALGPGSY